MTRRSALAAAGLVLAAGTACSAAPAAKAAGEQVRLTLAEPSGRQPIGTTSLHLVDHSRRDPWTSTPRDGERFWSNLRGWRRDLILLDSGHQTFTDLAPLTQQLEKALPIPKDVVANLTAATTTACYPVRPRATPRSTSCPEGPGTGLACGSPGSCARRGAGLFRPSWRIREGGRGAGDRDCSREFASCAEHGADAP